MPSEEVPRVTDLPPSIIPVENPSSRMQVLFDIRDQTAPGSPEEQQAVLDILDCIFNGGR